MEFLNNFLASVHYLNHPLLSGLSALSILLVGIFVLTKNSKSGLYRAFFGMTFILSVWFFGNALSMFYFDNFERVIFWFKFGYTSVSFLAVSYYIFYLAYFKKKNKIIYPLYIICLLEIFYLWFLGDIRSGAYFLPNVGMVWQGMSAFSYFLIFGMVKYIIVSAITFISFLGEYKKEIGLQKKQVKWLIIAFFVLILGSIEWLVVFNIPLHIAWVLIPAFIGIIAYAILKYQLMNINIIVKKVFFYSLSIALISGVIFGISFLNSWFAKNISGFKPWMIPVFAGIVAFIIGRLFYNKSKEVDKLKYEFITVAAHKLRTPLTEIKWAADALDEKILSEEERKNLTSGIKSANSRLIILADELLSMAKTEAGQYQYKFDPVDFEKMVRNEVNDCQRKMYEKGIKLSYNYDKDLPKVSIDKIRMPMIIQILLENAITYTKDEIIINLTKDKNEILFSIKDNGIGISKKDLSYIFSKFYRTHDAYKTETEGSGIGLYLAKSIVDKHNAKIGVNSEGQGKGSEFWVRVRMNN